VKKFSNVSVVVPANVYFDGKVTSRTVEFADGSKKTLGIMSPGEYEFSTGAPELIEITAGRLEVLLPGAAEWRSVQGGESFDVPGDSSFKLKIQELTDYVCSYIDV